jgi:hypothetical protein
MWWHALQATILRSVPSATAIAGSGHEKEKAMSIKNEFVLDVLSYTDWEDGEATPYGCNLYGTP